MNLRRRLSTAFALAATALVSCSGGSGRPVAPIQGTIGPTGSPTIAPTAGPSATPVLAPSTSPKPTGTATAIASAMPTTTAVATASATPAQTAMPTAVPANCGSPLPAGSSIFYAATENAVSVYAGDFTGSSTPGFSVQSDEYYPQTGDYSEIGNPFSVALGPNGNVYTLEYPSVSGAATTASVAEYPPNFGCTGPVAMLDGLPIGGSTPGGVAVDAAGYVYVASQDPRQLALYAPLASGAHAPLPLATVSIPPGSGGGLDSDPIGITLDAAGRIYIANGAANSILVYPARSGSSLASSPSATIVGSATTLNVANDVAVDAAGKIYVVDQDSPIAVKIFAANPSGLTNEAPTAEITGSQTKFLEPLNSIAIDHLGEIYAGAADSSGYSAIFEFAPNPSGSLNEAPQGMIVGSGRNPGGLAAK